MGDKRVALALALVLGGGWAEAQVPGPTFRINTYTTGNQRHVRAASTADGRVVFAWCHDADAIRARAFDGQGAASGEFQVNTMPTGQSCGFDGALAVGAGDPGFLVAWETTDTVRGQLFDWSGQRVGAEFQVNSVPSPARHPSVAWTAQAQFLLVWVKNTGTYDVYGQRFSAQGAPIGAEFAIDTTLGEADAPSVAAAADGRMQAVWNVAGGQIMGRRLDSSGTPLGVEFQVSLTGSAQPPAVALNQRGSMVVWWNGAVLARAFDTTANPLSGELVIDGGAQLPHVAPYGNERYVVAWDRTTGEKRARRFEADGQPHGPVFVVTGTRDYVAPQFPRPRVVTDAVGNMAFSWVRLMDLGDVFTDIMGRPFYGGLIPQGPAVDPVAAGASDGNGVLEACETVAFRPGWYNDTAATHALTGTAGGFTGPAGATYTIVDGTAAYGTLMDGTAASCTSDCYSVAVSCASPRPAAHWDTRLVETLAPVPQMGRWALHVGESFEDVPRASPYYRFVETLLHEAITAGCGAALYCPAIAITREQMAVFVLLAKEEPDFQPSPCFISSFPDVPPGSPTCPYIHALVRRGVATGCGGGMFCPGDPVTREQMAVFVLRTLDPALDPPACTTPMFADVPAASPFCRWVEELARRGVVAGCGNGLYCPGAAVTREQMAVFLSVAFGLSLYGP